MTCTFAILTWRGMDAKPRAMAIADVLPSFGLRETSRSARHIVFVVPTTRFESAAIGVTVFGRSHRTSHPLRNAEHDGVRASVSAARALTGSVWGSYVALFDMDGDLDVMVDPSGAGTAYEIADDDVSLVCDRVTPSLMREAGFDRSVDLDALRNCLEDPTSALQAKLLRGVLRLVPGRLHPLLGRHLPTTIWSPAMIAERRDDPEARLRNALDLVTSGTAGGRPLVQLSGGLDSSIIVGSLATIAPGTQAVTATSSAGDVEETSYARSAAAHAGVPLIEKPSDGFPDYSSFCDAPQIAHPYLHGLDDLFGDAIEDAGVQSGADRVMTGQGGDALFFHPPSPLVAVDRRRSLGSRASWPSLLDDARRSRSTIWHHLIPSEMDRIRKAGLPLHSMVPPWLSQRDAVSAVPAPHPWIVDVGDLPPGKRLHVAMLANCQLFHSERPSPGRLPLHHPLLSQPMMEAALSIPVWMLASGPLNRGLARRAFASRIPADVASRDSKGEATALYGRAAVANLAFLRDHLIEGALVRDGIVDAGRIHDALTPDQLFHSPHNHSLILLASCEAWLRAWR